MLEHGNRTPSSCSFTHWLQILPLIKVKEVRGEIEPFLDSLFRNAHFQDHTASPVLRGPWQRWFGCGVYQTQQSDPHHRSSRVLSTSGIGHSQVSPTSITEMATQQMGSTADQKPVGLPTAASAHCKRLRRPSFALNQVVPIAKVTRTAGNKSQRISIIAFAAVSPWGACCSPASSPCFLHLPWKCPIWVSSPLHFLSLFFGCCKAFTAGVTVSAWSGKHFQMLLEAPFIHSMLLVTVKQGGKHLPSMNVFLWDGKPIQTARRGENPPKFTVFLDFILFQLLRILCHQLLLPLPLLLPQGKIMRFKYEVSERCCCVWLGLIPHWRTQNRR